MIPRGRKSPVEVELYTKPGCHLCDEMKSVLVAAAAGLELELREIDISRDADLLDEYGEDIPVLWINGQKAAKHRASEAELRRRLRRAVSR